VGAATECSAYPRRVIESAEAANDVVIIHTDGGCRPNPGPGGWGAVLRQRQHVREMCGGDSGETSNNRMELTAPIMALEALTRPVTVHLYTDSTYVRNGITKWVLGWERNGWKTAAKQPVKNVDLWMRLQLACARHRVEWFWVKGHSGVADNELADELATRGLQEAIDAYSLTTSPGSLSGRSPRQLG
jgi:ribonuclease HI